jgi:proline iminopeptidase
MKSGRRQRARFTSREVSYGPPMPCYVQPVFATIDGRRLYYECLGDGSPLIFLHGGLGLDHTYFRPWLDPLADVRKLVFFDLEGNGRSDRPASFESFDHARWIQGVDAVRAALGSSQKFALFGHSYGAFLALEYATRHPENLSALILCSGAPRADYPEVIMGNAQRKASSPAHFAEVQRALSAPAVDDEAMRVGWETILPIYFHAYDAETARRACANIQYSAGALNQSMGVCLPRYDVTDKLAKIDVPTLILTGQDDWITPPVQGGHRLRDGIPGSELVLFERSGHFPFIEENERFVTIVRAWLARNVR